MWLHVPPQEPSSPSAPESLGSSAASDLLCPAFDLWLLLNGKPTRRRSSQLEWRTVPWIRHLSGTIWRPSTAARGAAAWISSLRASLASLPALPDGVPEPPMRDGSGPSSGASHATQELDGCSSRTCPGSSALEVDPRSRKSSGTWHRSGGMRSGTVFPRQPSAPLTSAIGCSSLPRLPTPVARDHKGVGREGQLPTTIAEMEASNENHGRPFLLNPRFVEWMMGWPLGWTDPDPTTTTAFTKRETESSVPQQLSLGLSCGQG